MCICACGNLFSCSWLIAAILKGKKTSNSAVNKVKWLYIRQTVLHGRMDGCIEHEKVFIRALQMLTLSKPNLWLNINNQFLSWHPIMWSPMWRCIIVHTHFLLACWKRLRRWGTWHRQWWLLAAKVLSWAALQGHKCGNFHSNINNTIRTYYY